jgi:hypothetical protein
MTEINKISEGNSQEFHQQGSLLGYNIDNKVNHGKEGEEWIRRERL